MRPGMCMHASNCLLFLRGVIRRGSYGGVRRRRGGGPEHHLCDVLRLLRDPSRVVRAHALHVFEDAARMQSAAERSYDLEAGEERLGGEAGGALPGHRGEVRSAKRSQS